MLDVVQKLLLFLINVVVKFRENQGFLLSGAVAYYTLLSIVPMFAIILVVLSQLVDEGLLLETADTYLQLVAPLKHAELLEQTKMYLVNWQIIGSIGVFILLFFSSLAFTSLENAMSVIFYHRVAIKRRHFLISAIIPYFYILFLALGLLSVSALSAALHSIDGDVLHIFGRMIPIDTATSVVIYVLGICGEVLLLTSLYLVMPVGKLAFRHAIIGGISATIMWELTRHFLVWYFSTLSLVNLIYGSFASAIVILLTCEAAAVILLLGAQVIANYENEYLGHADKAGWFTKLSS